MRRHWLMKILALGAALALLLSAAAPAEELGEMDLYDPAIYAGELPPSGPEIPAGEAAPVEPGAPAEEPVPVEPEAPAEEPAPTEPEAPAEEAAPVEPEIPAEEAAQAGPEVPAEEPVPVEPEVPVEEAAPAEPEAPAEEAAPAEPEAPAEDAVEEAQPAADETEPPAEEPQLPAAGEPLPDGEPLASLGDAPANFAEEAALSEDGAAVAAPEAGESAGQQETASQTAEEPDLRLGLGETYPLDGAALLGGGTPAAYASDHPGIASVDAQTGVITANALGLARVAVKGADGAVVSRLVAVLEAPKSLGFGASSLCLGKGDSFPLTVRVPDGAAAARFTYASSRESVVSVDASGTLKAKKTGKAKITATAYNGAEATVTVKVVKAPSKVKLSTGKLVLCLDETRQLKAVLPSGMVSRLAWASSDGGVVSVDDAGLLRGVAAGKATIGVRTYNGKTASCQVVVLDGRHPTSLSLGAKTLKLGLKEKLQLSPALGEGEVAVFAYSSSKKSVVSVSSKGVLTAKKKGTAKITVRTHNGLKATLTVKVVKAPSKVALSDSALALEAGRTARLTAKLPSGTASAIRWESSAPDVASVDETGTVTALKAGDAVIRGMTFNGKYALCKVSVSGATGDQPTDDPAAPSTLTESQQKMVANLRASSALGAKREAIANVIELMIGAGFEPAFAAGVGGNIYSEGTYGMFESSKYIANYLKRPRYFCYLDGGDYYTKKDGEYVLTAVYMSKEDMETYEGEAEARLRFAEENYYRDRYSGKYMQNVNLTELEAFIQVLAAGKWEGKFGLGITQWTGGRTKTLVSFYRKHAGAGNSITAAQVVAAENEMILYDFNGTYAGVYTAWKKQNSAAPDTAEAARSAGSLVCLKYEIPADKETKAVKRGNKAAEIYAIMTGG